MTEVKGRLVLTVRDEAVAQGHAATLREMGFEILGVTPHGVSFAGSDSLFERVFRSVRQPVAPKSLSEGVDSIYVPTPPSFH